MDCKCCGEGAAEFVAVQFGGRRRNRCRRCAEAVLAEDQVRAGAEAAMQGMMAYGGRG